MCFFNKQIFISYRRAGGSDFAGRVKLSLEKRSYSVFMDTEDLRSGPFNEQLYKKIEQATDFVLILPENSLDRCISDEEDWLRKEIAHAFKKKRNIVPVMLRNFKWPDEIILPMDLKKLPMQQGLQSSPELYEESITRLTRLLKSKPYRQFIKRLLPAFLLLGLLAGYFLSPYSHKSENNYYIPDAQAAMLEQIAISYNILSDPDPDRTQIKLLKDQLNELSGLKLPEYVKPYLQPIRSVISSGLDKRIYGGLPDATILNSVREITHGIIIILQIDRNVTSRLDKKHTGFYDTIFADAVSEFDKRVFTNRAETTSQLTNRKKIYFRCLLAADLFSKWQGRKTPNMTLGALALLGIDRTGLSADDNMLLTRVISVSSSIWQNRRTLYNETLSQALEWIRDYEIKAQCSNLNDQKLSEWGVTFEVQQAYKTINRYQ